jgi:hypothetical protein
MSVFEPTGRRRPHKYDAHYGPDRLTDARRKELEKQQIELFRGYHRRIRRVKNSPGLILLRDRHGEYLTASKIRRQATTVHLLPEARLFADLTLANFQECIINLFPGRGSRRFVNRVMQNRFVWEQRFDTMLSAPSESELSRAFASLVSTLISAGALEGALLSSDRTSECIVTNIVAVPLPGDDRVDRRSGVSVINDGSFIDSRGQVLCGFEFKNLRRWPGDDVYEKLNSAKVQANQHLNHEPATRASFLIFQHGWKCHSRKHLRSTGTCHHYRGSLFPAGVSFIRLSGPNASQGQRALVMCLVQIIFHIIRDQLYNNLISEPLPKSLRSRMA